MQKLGSMEFVSRVFLRCVRNASEGFSRYVVVKVHHASCIMLIVRNSLNSGTICLNAGVENRCGWTRNGESEQSLAGLQSYETFEAIGNLALTVRLYSQFGKLFGFVQCSWTPEDDGIGATKEVKDAHAPMGSSSLGNVTEQVVERHPEWKNESAQLREHDK